MRDKLMDKMEKKGKKLKPLEKKAKLDVVKSLSSQAGEMLSAKVKSLKEKVGKTGEGSDTLDKYVKESEGLVGKKVGPEGKDPEDTVEEAEEEMGLDLDRDNEEDESDEHASKVLEDKLDDCSDEELEAKLQRLIDLKNKRKAKEE